MNRGDLINKGVKKHSSKIIAGFSVIFVLALLLFSGPAQAFQLSLGSGIPSSVEKGQSVSTSATIEINSNERVNPTEITLSLVGPTNETCVFNATTGAEISGCNGIIIDPISQSNNPVFEYGYGYDQGYTNGTFTYNITLNTNNFEGGSYIASLSTTLGGHEYSSTQTFTISLTHLVTYINPTFITSSSITVAIPAGTTITGSYLWNGTLSGPTIVSNPAIILPSVAGYTASLSKVIEVGFSNINLTLSQPVSIVIPGETGKSVGYTYDGVHLIPITTRCVSATDSSNIAGNGECYWDTGANIIIWTKHFTQFVTYTQTINSSPYYHFGNNACTLVQLTPSQVGPNDYSSLAACQALVKVQVCQTVCNFGKCRTYCVWQ